MKQAGQTGRAGLGAGRDRFRRTSWRRGCTALASVAALLLGASAQAQHHIVGVGDSLTAGGDWLEHLVTLAPGWTWEEHGASGEQAWDAADGIHCSPTPEVCEVSQSTGRFRDVLAARTRAQGDVIVLMWGTNDVRQLCWSEANPRGPDDCRGYTRDSLAQMADDALALGYPVVIGVPPPFAEAPDSGHSAEEIALFNAHLEILRDLIEAIAAERPHRRLTIGDAYAHFELLLGWPDPDYYLRDGGVSDGVHPGTEPGPSGHSGRFHLAEPLVAASAAAASAPVPVADVRGWIGLTGALLVLAVSAQQRVRSRRRSAPARPRRRGRSRRRCER